jgi:predicted Zn finger-like uncharacterized protein
MSSFLAQCPHCLTSFRVTDSQLQAAEGLVRCGACLGIFSAASNRITLKLTPEEAAAAGLQETDEETDEDFEDFAPPGEQTAEAADDPEPEAKAAEETGAVEDEEVSPPTLPHEEPPLLAAEPVQTAAPRTDAAPAPDILDASDLLGDDFDVPMGDFNLDSDEEPERDPEQYEDAFVEDDEEYEDEDEDEDTDADDEYEDDDLEDEYETDEEDDFEEEEHEDDEDEDEDEDDNEELEDDVEYEFVIDTDAALAADEDEDYDDEPPPPRRAPVERVTTDKNALRQHLAALEDDDALGPLDDDELPAFDEPVTFVAAPRRSWLVSLALLVAIVLLAGALLLQYAQANMATLSRNARFAPALPYVCRVLDCPAQERSQLASLVSEQLVVRSHPQYAQALEVSFVFRNDATEAQPFPAIEIGFSDTNGRLLANRLFKPSEYLPKELQTSEMPPQSSLQITLEMVDPGSEAVNYTLAFREP